MTIDTKHSLNMFYYLFYQEAQKLQLNGYEGFWHKLFKEFNLMYYFLIFIGMFIVITYYFFSRNWKTENCSPEVLGATFHIQNPCRQIIE